MRVPGRLTPLLVVAVALGACSSSAGSSTPSTTAATPVPGSLAPATGSPAAGSGPTTTSATRELGPVFIEPDAGLGPIYRFMEGARTSLTMTMYELVDPTAEHILAADAGRGVRVRVLLDSALENSHNRAAQVYLSSHGVVVALAPATRITHQKTICTDDNACLVMSLNMVATDYRTTRDVAVEDTDPTDVAAIERVFDSDFTDGAASMTAPTAHLLWSPGSEPGIVGVINRARHALLVENEEMDSTTVTDALVSAAHRGVDVEVCMTADAAYHRALARIVGAGGHVHQYADRANVLYIHEKLVLADPGTGAATALVGSINFSTSSMNYNRELDLVLTAGDAVTSIAALWASFNQDFSGAPAL